MKARTTVGVWAAILGAGCGGVLALIAVSQPGPATPAGVLHIERTGPASISTLSGGAVFLDTPVYYQFQGRERTDVWQRSFTSVDTLREELNHPTVPTTLNATQLGYSAPHPEDKWLGVIISMVWCSVGVCLCARAGVAQGCGESAP